MNKVILMGTLTRDPEIKYTPKGTAIGGFSFAYNRKWKTEGGEAHEKVSYFDCEAWGRTAEVIGEYFKKGSKILITGELDLDTWDDKQTGQKRSKVKIRVVEFDFVDSKRDGGTRDHSEADAAASRSASRPPGRPATQPPRPPADPDLDAADDDIPF